MINKLLALLGAEQAEIKEELSVPMATAVLFYEIVRADDKLDVDEIEMFERLVLQEFAIPESEFESIFQQIENSSRKAVDFAQFTRVINEACSIDQKKRILTSLWHLSMADGHLDADEEHLIRRIADLLHLRHSEFIQTKLDASGEDKG